jgi:hypothetical protein
MVDGFSWLFVDVWFYLELEKRREISSYLYYIKFSYAHILIFCFYMFPLFVVVFEIRNTFCYTTITTT